MGAGVLLAAMTGSQAAGGTYKLVYINTGQGGGASVPIAIGPDNTAAGWVVDPQTFQFQPAFFRPDGSTQRLPLPEGALGGRALGINADGVIVGEANLPTGNHAVLWRGGLVSDLSELLPGTSSEGRAINDAGDVLVNVDNQRPFLIRGGPEVIEITVPGAVGAFGYALNEKRQVVGDASFAAGQGGFVWENGTAQALPPLAGDQGVVVRDINEKGEIAGSSINSARGTRAVVWKNRVPTALPNLKGTQSGFAAGINDSGLVCGQGSRKQEHHPRGVLWRGKKAVDVRAQVRPRGPAYVEPHAINAQGAMSGNAPARGGGSFPDGVLLIPR